MLEWIEKHISTLPARYTLFGLGYQWWFWSVPSRQCLVLGSWRSQNWQRMICRYQASLSVWAPSLRSCIHLFRTGPTYQGHGHESCVDTWFFPVSSLSSIQKCKTLPRLAANFHGITSKTTDHIPVMVDLEFNLVQPKPHQGFRWDREAMMRSMNDLSCQKT